MPFEEIDSLSLRRRVLRLMDAVSPLCAEEARRSDRNLRLGGCGSRRSRAVCSAFWPRVSYRLSRLLRLQVKEGRVNPQRVCFALGRRFSAFGQQLPLPPPLCLSLPALDDDADPRFHGGRLLPLCARHASSSTQRRCSQWR